MYERSVTSIWGGRIDSEDNENSFLVHQKIKELDSPFVNKNRGVVILGFACDEGVRRNKGRVGAKKGSYELKKTFGNFASHWKELSIYDGGCVICEGGKIEESQLELSEEIYKIMSAGHFPFILGGGHETAYGSYSGLKKYLGETDPSNSIGIINFDAHFDLRNYKQSISSGTPFLQIADDCKVDNVDFNYFCFGISKANNTRTLFKTADNLGVNYVLDSEVNFYNIQNLEKKLDLFIKNSETIYLSIDMDVLPCYIASGVSAPAPLGITIEMLMYFLRFILINYRDKVKLVDVVEFAPVYDIDGQTARIASRLIYDIIDIISNSQAFIKS